MSTTPEPQGVTAAIIGGAPVVHAAEAVNYGPPDLETEADGECAPLPVLVPEVT